MEKPKLRKATKAEILALKKDEVFLIRNLTTGDTTYYQLTEVYGSSLIKYRIKGSTFDTSTSIGSITPDGFFMVKIIKSGIGVEKQKCQFFIEEQPKPELMTKILISDDNIWMAVVRWFENKREAAVDMLITGFDKEGEKIEGNFEFKVSVTEEMVMKVQEFAKFASLTIIPK